MGRVRDRNTEPRRVQGGKEQEARSSSNQHRGGDWGPSFEGKMRPKGRDLWLGRHTSVGGRSDPPH